MLNLVHVSVFCCGVCGQEDFLKWKGPLFFRFILTLLDPHPEISSFGMLCSFPLHFVPLEVFFFFFFLGGGGGGGLFLYFKIVHTDRFCQTPCCAWVQALGFLFLNASDLM